MAMDSKVIFLGIGYMFHLMSVISFRDLIIDVSSL